MPTLCDDVKWITRRPRTLVINTKSSRVTSMWQQLYHRDGAQDLQDVLFHVGASDEVTGSQKAVWNILDFHVSVYSDGIMIQTAFYFKILTKIRSWQSKPLTKAAKELNIQSKREFSLVSPHLKQTSCMSHVKKANDVFIWHFTINIVKLSSP